MSKETLIKFKSTASYEIKFDTIINLGETARTRTATANLNKNENKEFQSELNSNFAGSMDNVIKSTLNAPKIDKVKFSGDPMRFTRFMTMFEAIN